MSTGSTLNPWLAGGGLLLQGVGAGLSYAQEQEEKKRREAMEREMFDWQKHTDTAKLAQGQQSLGQNAIASMRGNFKNALYQSLTRY